MNEKLENIKMAYDQVKIETVGIENLKNEMALFIKITEPLIKHIDDSILASIESDASSESSSASLYKCVMGIKNHFIATANQYKRNLLIADSINNISSMQDKKIKELIDSLEIKERFKSQIDEKIENGEDPRKRKIGEPPIPEREIRLNTETSGE